MGTKERFDEPAGAGAPGKDGAPSASREGLAAWAIMPPDQPQEMSVPLAPRFMLVVVVAGAAGWFTWMVTQPPLFPGDFQFFWRAARLWLSGIDPYGLRPHTALWPLWDRIFYPLPALILVAPLARASLPVAHAVFVTAGVALLAWRLTRDALWPLLVFASPSMLTAALLGQWSPWLTFAALSPSAGFLLAAKPTLGLACWLYRPSWRGFWSGFAIVALSLALMPTWPLRWHDNLQTVAQHPAPVIYSWGPVLALALLRWRTREGRLLLAMACMPQLLFFADQMPLFLVARTRNEALAFTGWGLAVMGVFFSRLGGDGPLVGYAAPWAMLACYLPALCIVLRHPNAGPVPMWLAARRRTRDRSRRVLW